MKHAWLVAMVLLLALSSSGQVAPDPARADHRWVIGMGLLPIAVGQWQLEAEWVSTVPRLSVLPQFFVTDVRSTQESASRGFTRAQRMGLGVSARYYLDDLAFRSFVQTGAYYHFSNILYQEERFVPITYDGNPAFAWRRVDVNRATAGFGGQLLMGLQWARGPLVLEGSFGALVRQLYIEPKELNRFFTGLERGLYGYYPFVLQASLKAGFRF